MRAHGLKVLAAEVGRALGCGWLVVAAVLAGGGAVPTGAPTLLDGFEETSAWEAHPAAGVAMHLASAEGACGGALRLDYDFRGRGGWATARRKLPLELPTNWELALRWKGSGARQTLEVKLLDSTGENVWWAVRREVRAPSQWQRLAFKKRHFSFAWGPSGGGEITRIGYIELTVTAGEGGAGQVWFDQLVLTPLPPSRPYEGAPVLKASSSAGDSRPGLAMDGKVTTAWRSLPGAGSGAWLEVDFGQRRELGGVVVTWGEEGAPASYTVELSPDGVHWREEWRVAVVHPKKSWVPLPEAEARAVRLAMEGLPPRGGAVAEVEIAPLEFAATPNDFITAVARDSRRGLFPRSFLGEMSSWTVVGASPGGRWRGLLSADGAFEPAPRSFSLEPLVGLDGQLLTWADVEVTQSLAEGSLPIPTVRWLHPRVALEATAVVEEGEVSATWLRYRLTNRGDRPLAPQLLLAVRPFQVNPPSQFLNTPGGVAEEQVLILTPHFATLRPANLQILPLPRPAAVAGVPFDGGDIVAHLERGEWPHHGRPAGPYPSGAFRWEFKLPPGEAAEVVVLLPHLEERAGVDPQQLVGWAAGGGDVATEFAARWQRTAQRWRARLGQVELRLPHQAQELLDTARANQAYVLINRDGPALQPGARAYRRSWIRDGAMMAAALLRLGHTQEVKEFARWYAKFQYEDGKVPCCVDHRGADPVPEHDSHGQFIFLVAETVRMTGDRVFAAELWPRAESAAFAIDALRGQRRGPAYRAGEARRFYGLLPESISHEGYSAKPMHSFWDTFWALRGLEDAAWLAQQLGEGDAARRWARAARELRRDVVASLGATMRHHGIGYLPGCAELGDFDPTSTSVTLSPAGVAHWLPRAALERTFAEYWQRFAARRDGLAPWGDFTPYELRTVGVFIRLGWREKACELLEWFLAHRQVPAWRQWPEIVWSEPTARFLGDLPHTWVGSDFLRAFGDIFAYERPEDEALVLAAGIPKAWLDSGEEIAVRGLGTYYGPLTYSVRTEEGRIRLRLEGGLRVPPGGVVVALPGVGTGWKGKVNGRQRRASPAGHFTVFEIFLHLEVAGPARQPSKDFSCSSPRLRWGPPGDRWCE